MAVTQHFIIDLPEDLVAAPDQDQGWSLTLTRPQAESLHRDLGEALGLGNVQGAEEGIQAAVAAALSNLVGMLPDDGQAPEPVGRQMSTEEALARVQAQEQSVPTPPVRRNPGTGIGNG